jgi:diguanylate cyclase (GGDEF)-like protein
MPLDERLARTMRFVIRNRIIFQDLLFVIAAVLVTGYVALDVDLFVAEGGKPVPGTIEADEMPVIGAVLCLGLLVFAWRRSQEQRREFQRRLAAEQQARALALQDPLTGMPNRRQFTDALVTAVAAPPRSDGAHALLMIDLNGFKQVNDVYGHGAGDETLIVVGQRLSALVRKGDLVARLGGDEFAIVAQHLAGAEAVTSIALRVIEALSIPITVAGAQRQIGAGIGICLLPFQGNTPEETMRRADVALYKAKADRRSSLRFFNQEMDENVRERELLERELREAIAREQIRPFFQPLVDLRTQEIIGFEALARWRHGDLGEIPPDRFIPIAEDSGLIRELTDQLLHAACEAARDWPTHVTLSFNISPVQLKDRTLGLRVLTILGQSGLLPQRLEIEITESALVRDLEAAQEVLGVLRTSGVRIALDDFGTGYSSLYHLRNFKFDKIKIDRSFVSRMNSERESAEIVNALIGLGHGLGLTITAEGIEEGQQTAALLAGGCQQGQGFLFGKAVPAEDAAALFLPAPSRATGT